MGEVVDLNDHPTEPAAATTATAQDDRTGIPMIGRNGWSRLRIIGISYLVVALSLLWLARTAFGPQELTMMMALEAATGLILGVFGGLLAVSPHRVGWTLKPPLGPAILLAAALGGTVVALTGVVVG